MSNARSTTEHDRLIVDQFTRMAAPFAEMPAHSEQVSLRLLGEAAAIGREDRVLDVCCGPGIVSCALASDAAHVTGIDITPAMIDQARLLQRKKGLTNVAWEIGNVTALPFSDGAFSVALSRYAFHHLLDPSRVLSEMARVCEPGGRVALADVFVTSADQGAAYDRVEKLRDPSHVRALRLEELQSMFASAGLELTRTEFYRLAVDLDSLLSASRTLADAADQVRKLLVADVGRNQTGMEPKRVGGGIEFSFPVVILAGKTGFGV